MNTRTNEQTPRDAKRTPKISVCTRKNLIAMNDRIDAIKEAINDGFNIIGKDVVNNAGVVRSAGKDKFTFKSSVGVSRTVYKVDMASYIKFGKLFTEDETNIGYPIDGDPTNISFENITYIKTNITVSESQKTELGITNGGQEDIVKFFLLGNKIAKDGTMTDRYNNPIIPNRLTEGQYPKVYMCSESVPIHRIQAYNKYGKEIFKVGILVRHFDDNKENYTYQNLIIGNHQQNMEDKVRNSGYYERQAEVVEMFSKTQSVQKTAKRTKSSINFVYSALNNAEIDWKYLNTDTGTLSERTVDEMRIMAKNGCTASSIASLYNVSTSTVSVYCRAEFDAYKQTVKEQIASLLTTRLKQKDIAGMFKVSSSYISSIKKEYNL